MNLFFTIDIRFFKKMGGGGVKTGCVSGLTCDALTLKVKQQALPKGQCYLRTYTLSNI
jgi:hypothetical protein